MTYFGPTRAEMIFRISMSILGLILLGAAVALRGIPDEFFSLLLLTAATTFFLGSAAISGLRLKRLDEE